MSRIGKSPVIVPKGVEVNIDNNLIKVKGPKGELNQPFNTSITISVDEGKINFKRSSDDKNVRALHGLYRSLVNNMVVGVSQGYKVEQELIGVGYRANATGQQLELSLGFLIM
jgi:large subunit ribosomal protein L6